jgi:hypothetical protein
MPVRKARRAGFTPNRAHLNLQNIKAVTLHQKTTPQGITPRSTPNRTTQKPPIIEKYSVNNYP